MNYKVLYRKYRPENFEDIVGQGYIIKTLKNSIINNSISHAYIFSGARGTGKTTTAKVFAKSINCLNQQNGSPCGKCEFCLNYNENPDIIEMDAASNNGVDEIREIIDNVKLAPTNGKYKVYIIDEVHMLTPSAFNALLLTLEEPPSHIVFILATTNIENVPITILSRCQRFDFQKIGVNDIINNLKMVCSKEKIDIEDDALEEIAYLSEGGMRDALSLLDQLSKNTEKITLELLENQFKTITKKNIDDLIDTIENNNIDSFLQQINEYRKRNIDYKSLLKKIVEILSNRAKKIKQTGRIVRLSFVDYKNLILELSECFVKININVDAYTIIEMIILNYFEKENKNISNSLKNVDEKKVKKIPSNKDNSNFLKTRVNNCFVNAKKSYLEEAKNVINDTCNNGLISGRIKSLLVDCSVVAASDNYIIISCDNEQIENKENAEVEIIEAAIFDATKKHFKIVFVTNDRWNQLKMEYIENIKNGKPYKLIDEKESTNELIINDVFDKSIVEII